MHDGVIVSVKYLPTAVFCAVEGVMAIEYDTYRVYWPDGGSAESADDVTVIVNEVGMGGGMKFKLRAEVTFESLGDDIAKQFARKPR